MNEKIKVKVGIMALMCLAMAPLAIVPSLANIAQSFPNSSASMIQMLLSVPSLMSLISALVIGKISVSISKKTLCATGLLIVLLGGLTPFFIHNNLYILLACAGIVGAGAGVITTLVPSLISENFQGHERGAVFGLMTAFVSIGAVILTLFGGKLAVKGWEHNYLIYLIAIPILIIAIFTLPSKSISESENGHINHDNKQIKLNSKVFKLGAFAFMFLMIYNTFPNNIALYLASNKIGDPSTAGLVSALGLVGGLLCGIAFGKISLFTKNYTVMTGFIINTIGLILTVSTVSLPVIMAGSFVTGASLSIFMARAPFIIGSIVSPTSIPMAIAVYSACTSLAGFLAPIIINNIAKYTLGESPKSALIISGALSLITAIVLLISKFERTCLEKDKEEKLEEVKA